MELERGDEHVCCGNVVVRASDMQPRGRRFDSRPRRFTFNLGQVVHTCASVHQAVNWYWRKLGTKQALHATHYSPVSVELQLRLWCLAEGY